MARKIKLTKLADQMEANISIMYHNNQGRIYSALIDGVVKVDDERGQVPLGHGSTPKNALRSYVRQIKGQTLILRKGRRNVKVDVPVNIEA